MKAGQSHLVRQPTSSQTPIHPRSEAPSVARMRHDVEDNAIREVGFHEGFEGYALGEDLDFSLRIRQKGKLVVAGSAHVLHLQAPEGRPSHYEFGYMAIYNRYQIHRRVLCDRRWYDILWFGYTWMLDTLLLLRRLFSTQKRGANLQRIAGRMKAGYDILRER